MVTSMEREFKKYNSIENTYREKFIEMIKSKAPQLINAQWSITEKIHGANVQICLEGDEIEVGKRTAFIEGEENFYNIQQVLGEHFNNVRRLKHGIEEIKAEPIDRIIVFGELFGGTYRHKDVEPVKNASTIQKGVQYCPQNSVIFFDIWVEYSNGTSEYLAPSVFEKFMEYAKLPYQRSIVVNSLQEALDYPNDEPSLIYQRFHLPQLEDNIREGVVIKPYRTDVFIHNGQRVILKNKNERFAEVSRHPKKEVKPTDLPDKLQAILNELEAYITENRLNNVLSHIGEVTINDVGKVIGLMNKDVMDNYQADTGNFNTLEKSENKAISKRVNQLVSKFVRDTLLPKL